MFWGGDANKNIRARMAWATAALPRTERGIKVFDSYAQALALLAKMVIRGLT
jgi:hypothetical protein